MPIPFRPLQLRLHLPTLDRFTFCTEMDTYSPHLGREWSRAIMTLSLNASLILHTLVQSLRGKLAREATYQLRVISNFYKATGPSDGSLDSHIHDWSPITWDLGRPKSGEFSLWMS
jgi:hypothetical protein